MNIIFLGGFIPKSHRNLINTESIGSIQHAADSLQHGFLEGLSKCLPNRLLTINLPFIGSYPRKFRKIFYPSSIDTINGTEILTIKFLNLAIIKYFYRTYASIKNLLYQTHNGDWVVVYSAHPPFLISALLCKIVKRKIHLCLILPDLPEHMGRQTGLQGTLNKIYTKLFYRAILKFDCFALLTSKMAERIGITKDKYVIIEGIATPKLDANIKCTTFSNVRSILYTGTLAEKYGVKNLIDAFLKLDNQNIRLFICGEGDSKSYIEEKSKLDYRIKFFGQVDRLESIKLQNNSTILINPRLPGDEYTEYSFPSKVMEYMSSGRPVVMYRLPGIPDEYFQHCIVPDDLSVEKLSSCIKAALEMSEDELTKIGAHARNFVLECKNPVVQANKLLDLMKSIG